MKVIFSLAYCMLSFAPPLANAQKATGAYQYGFNQASDLWSSNEYGCDSFEEITDEAVKDCETIYFLWGKQKDDCKRGAWDFAVYQGRECVTLETCHMLGNLAAFGVSAQICPASANTAKSKKFFFPPICVEIAMIQCQHSTITRIDDLAKRGECGKKYDALGFLSKDLKKIVQRCEKEVERLAYGRKIIKLRKDVQAKGLLDVFLKGNPGASYREYTSVLHGFAVSGIPDLAIQNMIRDNPEAILAVFDDDEVKAAEIPWGLDRIDQETNNLDSHFETAFSGIGVDIYIIDSGVQTTHGEFQGRTESGADFTSDGNIDEDGHGTHVAGIAAGRICGVAKQATIIPVRVLDAYGRGYISDVIAGLDWVANKHMTRGGKSVANLSIDAGVGNDGLDDAVNSAIAQGVVVVVAAGNDNSDACYTSPARVKAAITVGSTTIADKRSPFSNKGSCVDIFAPGSSIKSSWIGPSNNEFFFDSGTSMAAPHVAGTAALMLQANPSLPTSEVKERLINTAMVGTLRSIGSGSPNLLLYTGDLSDGSQPAPPSLAPSLLPTPVDTQPQLTRQLKVEVVLDNYPEETSFFLFDEAANTYEEFWGDEQSSSTMMTVDVVDGCYQFKISDSWGDGICCSWGSGSFTITKIVGDSSQILVTGGEFGSFDSWWVKVAEEDMKVFNKETSPC